MCLSTVGELKPTTHPAEFCLAATTRFPKLLNIVLICFSAPVNGVAAKRSLWPPCVADANIIFLPCRLFFFSSPNLSRRRLDVCHTSYFHTQCGLSANLRCRSETCCTRLAENTGRKNSPKNRHLGIIAQLCRAISSQLRHASTIEKKLLK